MIKNLKLQYDANVDITEVLSTRPTIPSDYHCTCEYCRTNFLGEIYNVSINKYYSQKAREHYYPPVVDKHLAPGHFLGYRWAIQQFTTAGDMILDPTVGTGTAIVEAINHGRHGIGIELEYPEIARRNIAHQYKRLIDPAKGKHILIAGDARHLATELAAHRVSPGSVDLVLNGTPYPKLHSSYSSDAPQRTLRIKNGIKTEKTFNYENPDNFGLQKGEAFWSLIRDMYRDCETFMKPGAKMVILIKDMVQGGTPYLLHKLVIDEILTACPSLSLYGSYIHKHIPQTVFMLSYPKQHPSAAQIPLYQTGIVLQKSL